MPAARPVASVTSAILSAVANGKSTARVHPYNKLWGRLLKPVAASVSEQTRVVPPGALSAVHSLTLMATQPSESIPHPCPVPPHSNNPHP
jgi:hypothetical protein